MLLKELGAICKEAKALRLLEDAEGALWAGTSAVLWQIPRGLGKISADTLCAIWDISPEKTELMELEEGEFPEVYDTDPNDPNEKALLWWNGRRLVLDGKDVLPLKAPGGEILMITTKYIKPGKDAEQPGLFLRYTEEGAPYIVCKDGMFVNAVILPGYPSPEQMGWIGDVCRGATLG